MKQAIFVTSHMAAITAFFICTVAPLSSVLAVENPPNQSIKQTIENSKKNVPFEKSLSSTPKKQNYVANNSLLKFYGWHQGIKKNSATRDISATSFSMNNLDNLIPGPAAMPERVMPDAQVVTFLEASGYNTVFLELEKEGEKFWVASTKQNIKTGTRVRFSADKAIRLANFKSKSLNRTFENIYFVTEVAIIQ